MNTLKRFFLANILLFGIVAQAQPECFTNLKSFNEKEAAGKVPSVFQQLPGKTFYGKRSNGASSESTFTVDNEGIKVRMTHPNNFLNVAASNIDIAEVCTEGSNFYFTKKSCTGKKPDACPTLRQCNDKCEEDNTRLMGILRDDIKITQCQVACPDTRHRCLIPCWYVGTLSNDRKNFRLEVHGNTDYSDQPVDHPARKARGQPVYGQN